MPKPRTALVTGANRGLGRAIATSLAAHPDLQVLVAARNASDAASAASRIGAGTLGIELDLDSPSQVAVRAAEIEAEHGPIDILVNNAAVLIEGDALGLSPAELTASLCVNAISPFALIHVLGAGMKARGFGRIVNVSSGLGSFAEGLTGPTAYSVSKAALNAVTVSAASALGERVKVNALCPGWVRTRMGGEHAERSPEQGADTAIWLATLGDDGPTGGFFRDRERIEW